MRYIKATLEELIGKKIISISGLEKESEEVAFFCTSGEIFTFFHDFDCCESVYLEDFELSCSSLIDATILSAEEVEGYDAGEPEGYIESYTWTFYKIETDKGGLWMRWLGLSNGYYSESIQLRKS